jgi:hypothetical protein
VTEDRRPDAGLGRVEEVEASGRRIVGKPGEELEVAGGERDIEAEAGNWGDGELTLFALCCLN